jgi:hypothetical protein
VNRRRKVRQRIFKEKTDMKTYKQIVEVMETWEGADYDAIEKFVCLELPHRTLRFSAEAILPTPKCFDHFRVETVPTVDFISELPDHRKSTNSTQSRELFPYFNRENVTLEGCSRTDGLRHCGPLGPEGAITGSK